MANVSAPEDSKMYMENVYPFVVKMKSESKIFVSVPKDSNFTAILVSLPAETMKLESMENAYVSKDTNGFLANALSHAVAMRSELMENVFALLEQSPSEMLVCLAPRTPMKRRESVSALNMGTGSTKKSLCVKPKFPDALRNPSGTKPSLNVSAPPAMST